MFWFCGEQKGWRRWLLSCDVRGKWVGVDITKGQYIKSMIVRGFSVQWWHPGQYLDWPCLAPEVCFWTLWQPLPVLATFMTHYSFDATINPPYNGGLSQGGPDCDFQQLRYTILNVFINFSVKHYDGQLAIDYYVVLLSTFLRIISFLTYFISLNQLFWAKAMSTMMRFWREGIGTVNGANDYPLYWPVCSDICRQNQGTPWLSNSTKISDESDLNKSTCISFRLPPYIVSEAEAMFYYLGILPSFPPTLVYCTSTNPIVLPKGPEAYHCLKYLHSVNNHKIVNKWKDVRHKIHNFVGKNNVQFSTINLVHFCMVLNQQTVEVISPHVIWIGVLPNSLAGKDAFKLANAILQENSRLS